MAQLNFSESSAFDHSDNEYDNADTIPMEFIKVEHIYDVSIKKYSFIIMIWIKSLLRVFTENKLIVVIACICSCKHTYFCSTTKE
ncbi:Protein of unknown function [Gryllus bimaculatus]|nr:Protein of unknown function [Gryllus bimaculatus]